MFDRNGRKLITGDRVFVEAVVTEVGVTGDYVEIKVPCRGKHDTYLVLNPSQVEVFEDLTFPDGEIVGHAV